MDEVAKLGIINLLNSEEGYDFVTSALRAHASTIIESEHPLDLPEDYRWPGCYSYNQWRRTAHKVRILINE